MPIKTILTALVITCVAAAAQADVGRVKKVKGEAFIERSGQRIEALQGTILEPKDVLVTGPDSSVSVTFVDNSRFSAGPNSRVEIETFDFNPTTHEGDFETSVAHGSLAIISGQIAKQRPDAMKVRTPTTILGVRGTRFIVEVEQ
jgi:hypothetical protein